MSRDDKVMVKLKSSDDQIFDVDVLVAYEWQAVKTIIEETGTDSVISLPQVSSNALSKVIEYCTFHLKAQMSFDETNKQEQKSFDEKMKRWDAKFMKVDWETLKELFLAADYLIIKNLLKLTAQTVADSIESVPANEIRRTFFKLNSENDSTPTGKR